MKRWLPTLWREQSWVFWGSTFVVLLLIPNFFTSDAYWGHIINEMAIYVILATGMNLAMGFGGQFNLAIGALFGIGAYTGGLGTIHALPFLLVLPLAILFGTLFGVLVGIPAIRVQSHYLALVTLGMGEAINILFVNWDTITGGPIGLPGIPFASIGPFSFSTETMLSYLIFTVMWCLLLFASVFVRSRFGRNLKAVRDDPIAAQSMGINLGVYKLTSFALSGAYAGAAGALYAVWLGYVGPSTFDLSQSIFILAQTLVGGVSTLAGPVIGAVALVGLQQKLLDTGDLQLIIYGSLIVIMVLVARGGIAGGLTAVWMVTRRRLLAHSTLIPILKKVGSHNTAEEDHRTPLSLSDEQGETTVTLSGESFNSAKQKAR
jgi:branched-chain amino acid transport system permease protein